MKFFDDFADTRPGGFIIQGLEIIAFIIVLKLIVNTLVPDSGVPGAIKAGINYV